MDSTYHDAIDAMEKAGVQRDYLLGWASGYLGNPKREEQRLTDAYEAGYEDGENRVTDGYTAWVEQVA